MKFSLIIPVYNRPDEIAELLESLRHQTYTDFEVLVIEDGSVNRCDDVVARYTGSLNIQYYYKENTGQGFSRNFGFERAAGDYFIILDSDCIIPRNYLQNVYDRLSTDYLDAFGGPDAAHSSFTPLQKAISYSMTSLITTGGIRGRKKRLGQFHPRSFNMGISRQVWEKAGGFIITRMGEDIEFSIRIIRLGFKVGLIPEAVVYHKRRTSLRQFYKQLFFFGRARVNIFRFYKSEFKPVHLLPALFTLFIITWLITLLLNPILFAGGAICVLLFSLLVFFDALRQGLGLKIALLSIATSFTQLAAYGNGVLKEMVSYLAHPEPVGLRHTRRS